MVTWYENDDDDDENTRTCNNNITEQISSSLLRYRSKNRHQGDSFSAKGENNGFSGQQLSRSDCIKRAT